MWKKTFRYRKIRESFLKEVIFFLKLKNELTIKYMHCGYMYHLVIF